RPPPPPRPLFPPLQAIDIRTTVPNRKGEVRRISLGDRRPRLQQERLIAVGGVEHVHLEPPRTRVRPLQAIDIRTTVPIEVANRKVEVRRRISLGDRRPR